MGPIGGSTGRAAGLALLGLAVLLLAGCTAKSGSSFRFDWDVFSTQIVQPDRAILGGLYLTVVISIISQAIGVGLGVVAALGRMSRRLPLRLVAGAYVWVFRGTPLLVQLVFLYFGLSVAHIYSWPTISLLGVPIPGAIQAGIVALGLNEGAYMSEIVRAGIISIDPGQMEAAKSLGMTYGVGMRRIILPQAARVIVPPLGNEFNNMLKTTSLLFAIGVQELYETFVIKQGNNFQPFEMYLAAAVWFLALTTIWSLVQVRIERRFARGTAAGVNQATPGLRQRLAGLRGGAGQLTSGR
ncbi:MAG TPA: amino acid ABC transporter permease [Candidatus Limnocylindrales bacterium]|nr:amino acid ABC transporter permease [Candidatus Limnocylindrales bacterium]